MPEKKRNWTSIVAFVVLGAIVLQILLPVIGSVDIGPTLFVAVVFILPGIFIVVSMLRDSAEEEESPEDRIRRSNYQVATVCADLILQFLALSHSIIADPNRLLTDGELALIPALSGKILALTDDPPEIFLYALGAIYHRAGKYQKSFEFLDRLLHYENTFTAQSRRKLPYDLLNQAFQNRVSLLKYQGNVDGAEYLAVRFFEADSEENALTLLADCRRQIHGSLLNSIREASDNSDSNNSTGAGPEQNTGTDNHSNISDVLHRIYDSP
ncbi:MAG TPA: hypothetical protein VFC63_20990 [Blastocatellia bacterium]|nr:hypothetical protein [Blastocatellia bacterium]